MSAPSGSANAETPSLQAGRPTIDQHPAGEYPEGRTLRQQRTGGGWHMRR